MAPKVADQFRDLQIPTTCPSCGARHKFYYAWLRHAGGYCCPSCDRIVTVDLGELDEAMRRLDVAVKALRDVVNRAGAARDGLTARSRDSKR